MTLGELVETPRERRRSRPWKEALLLDRDHVRAMLQAGPKVVVHGLQIARYRDDGDVGLGTRQHRGRVVLDADAELDAEARDVAQIPADLQRAAANRADQAG